MVVKSFTPSYILRNIKLGAARNGAAIDVHQPPTFVNLSYDEEWEEKFNRHS